MVSVYEPPAAPPPPPILLLFFLLCTPIMKRLSLLWFSSPKSLLQAIMQFTLLCLLLAFFIIKFSTLDSSSHAALQVTPHQQASYVLPQTKPPSFIPKISDWDHHRRSFLANSTRLPPPPRNPRILLVTGSSPNECQNPHGDHYLLKFIKNKIDYCRLHGIDIFYNMAHLDREMTDCWSKLPLLRKLMLSHPEVEWLWWMDSDAMFTDMTFELPMEKYEKYNLVVHGFTEEVYERRSWTGLNAGVFLIRNCQWTLDLMDEWAPMGVSKEGRDELGKVFTRFLTNRPLFEGDDQAGLVYLMNTQKERWGSKVYLERAYYLHGYWEIIVDKYEKLMEGSHPGYGDERWPFVTHFVGCKPCGSLTKDRCLHHMQRAFNFGDNQILQRYGFHHPHLSTPALVPSS